jgi:uncharacterized NAD(P)/FAD-binding protein YdhS
MGGGPAIAIVGAGFTGVMTALQLLRYGPPNAQLHLIEKTPGFGRGRAFGAANPSHLLNVRAGNMSAFPDEPDHLIRWLADRNLIGGSAHAEARVPDADTFISRGAYGDYLYDLLRQAVAGADGAARLVLTPDQATGLIFDPPGATLSLAMGRQLRLDAVVLAVGNLPPLSPPIPGLSELPTGFYARDPWAPSSLANLDPDAPVLLLGSGLTMVDAVLDLVDRGHRGEMTAISRRGLSPLRHEQVIADPSPPSRLIGEPLSAWVRERRDRADQVGWRAAVDELRPITQALWRGAGPAERGRFLRHLRPWWDVVRHRMAPAVADRIEALRASGRLQVRAGRLVRVEAQDDRVAVLWRPRGQVETTNIAASRIINCTGVGADLLRTADPLLSSLLRQGAIRADPLGLGLEIDGLCQAIDRSGGTPWPLYAAGPITQGYAWEVTAVPDIRNQVVHLAKVLAERRPGDGAASEARRRRWRVSGLDR